MPRQLVNLVLEECCVIPYSWDDVMRSVVALIGEECMYLINQLRETEHVFLLQSLRDDGVLLVEVTVSMTRRKEVDVHAFEPVVLHQHAKVREHDHVFIVLGSVVHLEEAIRW